jgi:hypothetical protein
MENPPPVRALEAPIQLDDAVGGDLPTGNLKTG